MAYIIERDCTVFFDIVFVLFVFDVKVLSNVWELQYC